MKEHYIFYAWDDEAWEDSEDETFKVGMTSEGDSKELEQKFKSQEEFWTWYNNPKE